MKTKFVCLLAASLMLACISSRQPMTDEELAKKSGCFECHSIDEQVIGPKYRDVAAKYKDDNKAREDLFRKVKFGGKGNWTEVTRGVPMPPHSGRLSDEEITRLVGWVLGL